MTTTACTTAYLTRLRLNPHSSTVARSLQNAQALHERVMSVIPDQLGESTRAEAGVLYRLESSREGHTLLIQSAIPLDLSRLPVNFASATAERDLTNMLGWIREGRNVRYRIDAQPARSRPGKDGKRSSRVPLHGEAAVEWWMDRSAKNGFEVHSALDIPLPGIRGFKKRDDNPDKWQKVGGNRMRFEGVATVADVDKAMHALLNGIGRGRAYGCGLLSIAPMAS